MKKSFLYVLLLMLSYTASGQLNFGIKGAITMSSLSTDLDDISEAARTGWQAGAFLRVGEKLHLQPEVYFTAKAGQLQYADQITQDITFSSIDIPVLVGYKIIDPPTLNIRLQAGPGASLVTSKKFTVSADGIDPPEPSDEFKNSFKDMNWGLQVGAGVDFLFLTADLRYELGLSNLVKDSDGNPGSMTGTMKNNVFMLSVGWKIF